MLKPLVALCISKRLHHVDYLYNESSLITKKKTDYQYFFILTYLDIQTSYISIIHLIGKNKYNVNSFRQSLSIRIYAT